MGNEVGSIHSPWLSMGNKARSIHSPWLSMGNEARSIHPPWHVSHIVDRARLSRQERFTPAPSVLPFTCCLQPPSRPPPAGRRCLYATLVDPRVTHVSGPRATLVYPHVTHASGPHAMVLNPHVTHVLGPQAMVVNPHVTPVSDPHTMVNPQSLHWAPSAMWMEQLPSTYCTARTP